MGRVQQPVHHELKRGGAVAALMVGEVSLTVGRGVEAFGDGREQPPNLRHRHELPGAAVADAELELVMAANVLGENLVAVGETAGLGLIDRELDPDQ